jgi:hypothetical protein
LLRQVLLRIGHVIVLKKADLVSRGGGSERLLHQLWPPAPCTRLHVIETRSQLSGYYRRSSGAATWSASTRDGLPSNEQARA